MVNKTPIQLAAGNYASFWRGGSRRATYPSAAPFAFPIQSQLIPIAREYNIYLPLMFHESGKLKFGRLREPATFSVQGRDVLWRGDLCFYDNGGFRPSMLVNNADFTVQHREIAFLANRVVRFTDGGVLDMGTLARDTELEAATGPVRYPPLTFVTFDEEGVVVDAE